MSLHIRVAQQWLMAREVTAKSVNLKAIDFTLGLLKRLKATGLLAVDNGVLSRVIDMRAQAQGGLDLSTLPLNLRALQAAGSQILDKAQQLENTLAPQSDDLRAFLAPLSGNREAQVLDQARWLEKLIAQELKVPVATVRPRLLTDQAFMLQAYAVCSPVLSQAYSQIVSTMSAMPGQLEHRIKAGKSCWGKQSREGDIPFIEFADLVGVRLVAPDLASMAAAVHKVQDSFGVVRKVNYYLEGKGYNAINYSLQHGKLLFELQVKTQMNVVEAQISHDLIYAPEKAVSALTPEERRLVSLVIAISTQLSMREWSQAFGIAMRTARQRVG